MKTRRINALRELAKRGATEGERAAAQAALDKYETGTRAATPGETLSWSDVKQYRQSTAKEFYTHYAWKGWGAPTSGVRFDNPFRASWQCTPDPSPETRNATPEDFPEAPAAQEHTSDVLRIEVDSEDQAHEMYRVNVLVKYVWQQQVWEGHPSGLSIDYTHQRYYVHFQRRRSSAVKVPI